MHMASAGTPSGTAGPLAEESKGAPPATGQAQARKPFIPSLRVGGLGLSTLVKEGGKTQEELDVENLVANKGQAQAPAQAQPQLPAPAKKQPFVPSLKVGGLGLSTLVKDGGKTQEELDVEAMVKNKQPPAQPQRQEPQQPPVQPGPAQPQARKPFVPSLKVGGLGLSTLVKEHGKTQEELDVENEVKHGKQPNPSAPSQLQDSEAAGGAPKQPARKPFVPALKVGGLGLSTLVKDGGKTQEELDVESQVQSSKAGQPQARQGHPP